MCTTLFSCTNETFIEADSRLSAMETFLNDLRDDPGARTLLMTMVDQVGSIIVSGMKSGQLHQLYVGGLRRTVSALRRSISDLPETGIADEDSWEQVRESKQACQSELVRVIMKFCDCCTPQHAAA